MREVMFQLLKEKINGFVKGIVEKVGKKDKEEERRKETTEQNKQESGKKKQKKKRKEKTTSLTKAKLSLKTQITSLISKEITLTKEDILPFVEELELALLESDVSIEASEKIKEELLAKLVGTKVKKDNMLEEIKEKVKNILKEILMQVQPFDFEKEIEERIKQGKKPVKVLFIGTNGTGKTTTIAKLAYLFKNKHFPVVIAAGDTFRAAAVEQLQEHAKRLGVALIKAKYGADPAAVAYDAIKFAEKKGYYVVLIDSAGRQETNLNLMRELEKIARVNKPDYVIFIGEALAGHALMEQIKGMKTILPISACILTKKDCDAKGGVVFSIIQEGIPIAYFGIGQGYGDLERFDADKFLNELLE